MVNIYLNLDRKSPYKNPPLQDLRRRAYCRYCQLAKSKDTYLLVFPPNFLTRSVRLPAGRQAFLCGRAVGPLESQKAGRMFYPAYTMTDTSFFIFTLLSFAIFFLFAIH